jgi:hypothetical protein
MQSAQDWQGQNAPNGMDGTCCWRTLVQRQVCSGLVVIICVRSKHMAKVPLTKYDNMVKAAPSDRADGPFTIAILP